MSLRMNPSGNIELQQTVRELEERLHRVEKVVFKIDDGSGTGRYVDNWTQESDGTEYPPSSYGTGTATLKPFVPFDDLKVGDLVRVQNEDGTVDPMVYTVSSISEDGKLVYVKDDHPGYSRDKVVRVVTLV